MKVIQPDSIRIGQVNRHLLNFQLFLGHRLTGSRAAIAYAWFDYHMPDFATGVYSAIFHASMSWGDGRPNYLSGTAFSFAPQNIPQTPRPIGGLDKLETEFKKAVQFGDCKEALSKLLSKIGSDTNFAPSTTDIMTLYQALKSQTGGGGIFVDVPEAQVNDFLPERARGAAVGGGSGVSNFFYSDPSNWHTRQRFSVVFLKSTPTSTSQLNIDRQPYDYVVTLIHEIIHEAPNDSSGFGRNYEHPEMNGAAFALDGSTSMDAYIKKHCIPQKYW